MKKREAIFRDFSEMSPDQLERFNRALYEISQRAALKAACPRHSSDKTGSAQK
jgi:hypothetical protein